MHEIIKSQREVLCWAAITAQSHSSRQMVYQAALNRPFGVNAWFRYDVVFVTVADISTHSHGVIALNGQGDFARADYSLLYYPIAHRVGLHEEAKIEGQLISNAMVRPIDLTDSVWPVLG